MTVPHFFVAPTRHFVLFECPRQGTHPVSGLDRIQSRLLEIPKGSNKVGDLVLLGMAMSAVGVGCLVPNRWLPPLPNDKFLHFASFAVLAGLALRVAQGRVEALLWLLGLLLAGWLIECLQGAFVPDRRFCWRDMGANAAGIGFAALAAELYVSFF